MGYLKQLYGNVSDSVHGDNDFLLLCALTLWQHFMHVVSHNFDCCLMPRFSPYTLLSLIQPAASCTSWAHHQQILFCADEYVEKLLYTFGSQNLQWLVKKHFSMLAGETTDNSST